MSTQNDDDQDDPEAVWINEFIDSESSHFESPIDLNIGRMTTKVLGSLIWCSYEISPKKVKLTNTGKTVLLSTEWHDEPPFIAGGPFLSRQIFSQIHFHWGPNDMEGSDHSVDGERLAMEMHAVHFKSDYTNHEAAVRQADGISMLVYLFRPMENPKMNAVVESLKLIREAETSTRIIPWPISNLLRCFVDDYFLYRGSISTPNYGHSVTWLVSREPIGISIEQVAEFRTLKNINSESIGPKNRRMHNAIEDRIVYHVNPSGSMYSSILPISRSLLPPRFNNCSEENGETSPNEETNF